MTVGTDTFTRADSSTLGNTETGAFTWVEGHGDFSISSNRLVCTAVGASMALLETFVTDQDFQADCSPTGTGQTFIVARSTGLTDAGSLLAVGFGASSTVLQLYKVVTGAYTLVGSYSPGVHGGTVRIVVIGDAVTVYLNGVLRISYTITDASLRTGTKVGVYGGADANSVWDNVSVTTLVLGIFGDTGFAWGDALTGFGGGAAVFPPAPPPVPLVTYSVEVAFVSSYTDPPPEAWIDVSAYLRSFSIRRGRNHELGKTSAGVATITLDNRDRRFDPKNTSGPYYPNILPMQHVRIWGLYLGITRFDLFRGFIEDWGQQWGGPAAPGLGDATCEVQAVDAFKLFSLAQSRSLRSIILEDSPLGYWPCDDAAGGAQTVIADLVSDVDLSIVDGHAAAGIAGPLIGGALAISNAAGLHLYSADGLDEAWRLFDDATVEMWIYATSGASDLVQVLAGGFLLLSFGLTGTLHLELDSSAGSNPASTGTIGTGAWHHIAAVRSGLEIRYYIDGVLNSIVTGRPVTRISGSLSLLVVTIAGHRLAHLAIYDHALTAEEIATHHATNIDDFPAQSSGVAIGRLLDSVGWSSGLRTIDAGSSTVMFAAGGSTLDLMQQVAEDTEHGIFEIAPDGRVTFIGRGTLETLIPPYVTFGDGGGAEIPYRDLVLAYDDQDLWTEVDVSGPTGMLSATDAGATSFYGPRTLEVSTVAATSNELASQAIGLLNRYKAPAMRPTSVTFMGPRSIPQQFQRAVGDRVTVSRRPPGGGTLTIDAIIEGVNHDVGPDGWLTTSFSLAPPDPGVFWLLGDATYSVLGTTTLPGW